MKEAEGNEVEEVRGSERGGRRGKWRILLVVVLVVGAIAAVFYFRGPGIGEQLRDLADERGGDYYPGARGPGWYVKLAHKYKLPLLRQPLGFYSRTMSDEDMAVLGRAYSLDGVGLTGSEISDVGMAHLKGLTKLQTLDLESTEIGDAGLAHLSELTELWDLNLNGTKVSDAGLVHLKKLKNLRQLGLAGTRVTSEGIADLKLAIPNLKIY